MTAYKFRIFSKESCQYVFVNGQAHWFTLEAVTEAFCSIFSYKPVSEVFEIHKIKITEIMIVE